MIMNRHGANEVFLSSDNNEITDEDIDSILSKGMEKTKELTNTIEKAIPSDEQYLS